MAERFRPVDPGLIKANRNLLGISNIQQPNRPDLDHAGDEIAERLGGRNDVIIIPYAAKDMDASVERHIKALARFGVKSAISLHTQSPERAKKLIADGQGFYITGGNTFGLAGSLNADRHADGALVDKRPHANTQPIVEDLRKKAADRVAIVGTSAGVMILAQDIRTCSDARSYVRLTHDGSQQIRVDALDLLESPISIHPHYNSSLADELAEYPVVDPQSNILALPNGSYIVVDRMKMTYFGENPGSLFQNSGTSQLQPGQDISHILK